MSMANLIVQGENAYLLTDSGWWDEHGNLHALHRKVLTYPALGMAIAVRGAAGMTLSVAREIAVFCERVSDATGGDVAQNLSEIFFAACMIESDGVRAELTMAFYSPAHRRAFGLTIHNTPHPSLAAFEVVNVRSMLSQDRARWEGDVCDPAAFDPHRDGAALAHNQRIVATTPFWEGGGPAGHFIAGAIDLTTVGPAGVTTETIANYPDRIGAPVDIAVLAA